MASPPRCAAFTNGSDRYWYVIETEPLATLLSLADSFSKTCCESSTAWEVILMDVARKRRLCHTRQRMAYVRRYLLSAPPWGYGTYRISFGNAAVSFMNPTKDRGPVTVEAALVGTLVKFLTAAGIESRLAL